MHHFPWPSLFNFLCLVAGLVYFMREPLKAFVKTRHETLRDEVARVERQLKDSQVRFDEFSAKLKAIDAEIQALHEQMRQDADSTKVRVVSEAKRLSTQIITDARASAEGLYSELRGQLRTELADRVVARAEEVLRERLTGDDRVRFRYEFSQQLGGAR